MPARPPIGKSLFTLQIARHIARSLGDWTLRVLEVLRTRCGAAGRSELSRATGLEELEVIDALYALEQEGLVTPTVWRLTDLGGE